jgi:hypothetical protein
VGRDCFERRPGGFIAWFRLHVYRPEAQVFKFPFICGFIIDAVAYSVSPIFSLLARGVFWLWEEAKGLVSHLGWNPWDGERVGEEITEVR